MFTSFDCIKNKKAECTGSPIRRELYNGDKIKAARECGFSGKRKVLLAFGGSLGARSICEAVRKNAPSLCKKYDVILVTGAGNSRKSDVQGFVEKEFLPDIGNYFALADIVISRGGSNSLFELMSLKKPTLCIPLPKGISRGDQLDNAAYFSKKGCIEVLPDGEYLSENLLTAVESTDQNKKSLCKNMQKLKNTDGTRKIAHRILAAANGERIIGEQHPRNL